MLTKGCFRVVNNKTRCYENVDEEERQCQIKVALMFLSEGVEAPNIQ